MPNPIGPDPKISPEHIGVLIWTWHWGGAQVPESKRGKQLGSFRVAKGNDADSQGARQFIRLEGQKEGLPDLKSEQNLAISMWGNVGYSKPAR